MVPDKDRAVQGTFHNSSGPLGASLPHNTPDSVSSGLSALESVQSK